MAYILRSESHEGKVLYAGCIAGSNYYVIAQSLPTDLFIFLKVCKNLTWISPISVRYRTTGSWNSNIMYFF